MANLMGFKRVSSMPDNSKSYPYIYQPLLQEVHSKGGIYTLDVSDKKRAYSLAATIRSSIRKLCYSDVKVGVRNTIVFVTKKEKDNDTQN